MPRSPYPASLRSRLAHALDRRFAALHADLAGGRAELAAARDEIEVVRAETAAAGDDVAAARAETAAAHAELARLGDIVADMDARLAVLRDQSDEQVIPLLRELLIDDAGNRRRLEALRAAPLYAQAYDDPAPLVSICIATKRDRAHLLTERAIPSALAQTYPHVEIVVVGDGFDPREDPRVAALDDPRLRFGAVMHHLEDPDPRRAWFTGATLPRQEARALARGSWLTDLDDDDALCPAAVESLLNHARAGGVEVASGLMRRHVPGPEPPTVIEGIDPAFVPAWSMLPDGWRGRSCTAAIWHAGLRSFVRIRAAALLGVPGDLFLTIRLARAGVRFSVLDEVVYEYYPGLLWDQPAGLG